VVSKKKEDEEKEMQGQDQQKQIEKILEKIDEINAKLQDIYSQLGSLQRDFSEYADMWEDTLTNIDKVRKMVYWHRQTTEGENGSHKRGGYYNRKKDDREEK